jgi:hypothetical protein
MCRFVCAAAFALSGLFVARAEAAPVFYDFTLTFIEGRDPALVGQTIEGSLSVDGDDCTGPGGACEGLFVPGGLSGGMPRGDLLSLDLTIEGVAFSLANASVTEPTVAFSADNPFFIAASWHIDDVFLAILNNASYNVGQPPQFGAWDGEGRITFEGRGSDSEPVPEPASLVRKLAKLFKVMVTLG